MYTGLAASPGIALGKAYVFRQYDVNVSQEPVPEEALAQQVQKLDRALKDTQGQLEEIKEELKAKLSEEEARIFDAHIMLLEDPVYIDEIKSEIQEQRLSADNAVFKVSKNYIELFQNLEDPYMKERAADIRDVSDRIIKNLLGIPIKTLAHLVEDVVVIAHDLTPSDTAQMSKDHVLAFATDMGGKTSHSAIMARSLEIPAVVGLVDFSQKVSDGDLVIVDGNKGKVYINPDDATIEKYKMKREKHLAHLEKLKELKDLPAKTRDKKRQVDLAANIGTPEDVKSALEHGAEGVGLYRTEFLYMDRQSLPTEDEQFEAYKRVAKAMAPRPIIIRTLDIGGDKKLPYLDMPQEMNPFLGYRALRLCLDKTDIFKTQLRAILRASSYGKLRIMYPMVSSIGELEKANTILKDVREDLLEEGLSFDKDIEVGIMVEIPAAAIAADLLAPHVDFFSIGTNDLIQYTLAVDRMNEHISHLYQPFHPAVLRLIKNVIDASHKVGKWTGMCGEMAGDVEAAVLLLGLGLDEFSMSAPSIPLVKDLIRSLTYEEAKDLAAKALALERPEEIKALVRERIKSQS